MDLMHSCDVHEVVFLSDKSRRDGWRAREHRERGGRRSNEVRRKSKLHARAWVRGWGHVLRRTSSRWNPMCVHDVCFVFLP
eukprot:6176967-Pleurochrysis_carterae.AAC.1